MKPADMGWLRGQWDALMGLYKVDPVQSERVFFDLRARYEANGSYYHNLRHIQNVLQTIDSMQDLAADLPAIKLAAWFHDAVYDVRRSDNETQSAVLAGNILHSLGIDSATIAKVCYMIRATTHNGGCPADVDCQIMLDADLATFASDWTVQVAIEQAIRQEYAHVPDAAYRHGRKNVLTRFLNRERIYWTDLLYDEREADARRNIERAITELGG